MSGDQCVVGDVVVDERAAALAEVRAAGVAWAQAEAEAQRVACGAVRAGVLSEVAAAKAVGVQRHTLRGWLGKPRRRGGTG